MISQELLTELTEAGFPFSTETRLSELIEACGDDFESLVKREEDWAAYVTEDAYKGDCVYDCCGYRIGSTPEEAVAKLWLALNKK